MQSQHLELSDILPANWQLRPMLQGIRLLAPSSEEGILFFNGAKQLLKMSADRLTSAIEIAWDGCSEPLRIEGLIAQPQSVPDEPTRLLWVAHTPLTPTLLRVANELMQNPRRAGVVRLSDELQIIMSDACSVLNPGHTMNEATQWVRSQFWHPDDLAALRRATREHGSKRFEFRWRSFDPDLGMHDRTEGNWLEFATSYELIVDELGSAYQIANNLEYRIIAAPAAR